MADPVQTRLHESIRLLKQIIENVEGAELPGLPLVVNPIHIAVTVDVTGLHSVPSRAEWVNVDREHR